MMQHAAETAFKKQANLIDINRSVSLGEPPYYCLKHACNSFPKITYSDRISS